MCTILLGEAGALASGRGFSFAVFLIMAVILLFVIKRGGIAAFFDYGVKLVILFCILFAVGFLNAKSLNNKEKFAAEAEGRDCIIYGKIYDIREGDTYTQVYIRTSEIVGEIGEAAQTEEYEINTKIIAYLYTSVELYPGQRVAVSGQISLPDEPTNPGEFDSRKYYRNKGIFMTVRSGEITAKEQERITLRRILRNIREQAENVYDEVFNEANASVVKAMLLGVKTGMEKDVKRLYQLNGIAHVLAISGVHIAIIGMWLYGRLRKLIGSYWISGICAILIVALYGIMTGLAESTLRAILMLAITLVGNALGRSSDMMTSAGITCIIIAFANPYIVMDVGFQLSFAAVMGIAVINPVLIEVFGKEGKIRQSLFVSLSATLSTLPIIIYNYYQFPLYSVLLNLIVVPLVSVIIFFSIVTGFVGVINISTAKIFALPVKIILSLYELLCNAMERLPFYNINTGHISVAMIIIYYAVLGTALYIFLKRKEAVFKLLAAAILVIGLFYEYLSLDTDFKVVYLDVGQGDGILVKTENGTNILIDGGSSDNSGLGEYVLMPAVKYYGMATLDYVFVSHGDSDHTSGIEYLLEAEHTGITIKNLVVAKYGDMESLSDLIALAEGNGVNIIYIDAGQELSENEGLLVKCLFPNSESTYSDANNSSMVLEMEYQNKTFLFTGDIGEESEAQIINTYVNLDCDVLKVAHHGSKYSSTTEFLEKVTPEAAVISCGLNNSYGHPAAEALERLSFAGAEIYRTDLQGAIAIYFDDSGELEYRFLQ